jgi:glycosyltransferase involved in cell wall biosynthesis
VNTLLGSSVAILLGTYNGERFLEAQLDSLEAQSVTNWTLYVSDDGSTDATFDIIHRYQSKWGTDKIQYRLGPKKGFAQNFLSLACDTSIKADYYAFCDQDDVWLPEKLSVAIEHIARESFPEQLYAYGSRTTYTDEKLKPIGLSPLFVFPRTFRNALIQSIAGGNTMVFNQATKTLLEKVGMVPTPAHDWWLYQLVTGAGGLMYYDPEPHILYRQHDRSLVGSNTSLKSLLIRFGMLLNGRFKKWTDENIQSLNQAINFLKPEHIETLKLLEKMRNANFNDRLRLIQVSGLYRQTKRGTFSLAIASMLGKI